METLQEKQLTFNPNLILSNDGGQLSNDTGRSQTIEYLTSCLDLFESGVISYRSQTKYLMKNNLYEVFS